MPNDNTRLSIGEAFVALIDSLYYKKDIDSLIALRKITFNFIEFYDDVKYVVDFDAIMMHDYAADAIEAIEKGQTLDDLHQTLSYKGIFD